MSLPSSDTKIEFINKITESDTFNIIDFDYIYNGAGVGIADLNGDSLPDIYFGGNQTSSSLYLNQGEMKFLDVTATAGLETNYWVEGITFVDINKDGKLDIYLSVSNQNGALNPNRLFVNQGNNESGTPIFEEKSADYGLDLTGYFTQAAFFDYDKDGDLDCYLLTNALESFQRNLSRPRITDGSAKSNDRLLRNNGYGKFEDLSLESGIVYEGYGLGLAISDLNQDGWPDIYVGNDFLTNDLLYINQGNGTFQNQIHQRVDHQSFNSMGLDVGDINGDTWPDLIVVDMFPPDNLRQKTMFSPTENHSLYQVNLNKGYEPQYVRNVLQLNRGDGTFAEIGQLAGIAETDWSWSPLLEDYDLNGTQDLIISNGYGRDITDLDYINYTNNLGPFMTLEEKKNLQLDGLNTLKEVKLKNFAFRNNGDLTFEDVSREWGVDNLGISNGMAYADLDLDGDLDLVMNNLNQKAEIFENRSIRKGSSENSNWLKITLTGSSSNPFAIGATVKIYSKIKGKAIQIQKELYPSRGYKSASMDLLNFGLGKSTAADSIIVIWPNGKVSKKANLQANQTIHFTYEENLPLYQRVERKFSSSFVEVSRDLGLIPISLPLIYNDFNHQPLLHQKQSDLGPGIAVGDINGDGLEDFYLGGTIGNPGQFFIQNKEGAFDQKPLADSGIGDEMGILLFDADLDKDLDLYIVHGGSRTTDEAALQDSFYSNDGSGNFTKENSRIPLMNSSGSAVRAADYDSDGDLDLFVGGRQVPGRYPETPRSYLLQNLGGTFVDITPPELANIGMVSDALWTDYNQDGLVDLLIVGDWMPVTIFLLQNNSDGGVYWHKRIISNKGWDSKGWWTSIAPISWVQEEEPGYLLGNMGINSRWKANQKQPIELHFRDFDTNGSVDPILFQYIGEKSYPIPGRNQLVAQVPSWKNHFLVFREFAGMDRELFFQKEDQNSFETLQARELRSGILTNVDSFSPLPNIFQISRIFGALELSDQVFYVGNYFGNETVTGRSDASRGGIIDLKSPYHGANPDSNLGFEVPGDARAIAHLILKDQSSLLVVSRFNQPLLAFKKLKKNSAILLPEPNDRLAIWYQDGKVLKTQELFFGSGYLSQSTRNLQILPGADSLVLESFSGETRSLILDP